MAVKDDYDHQIVKRRNNMLRKSAVPLSVAVILLAMSDVVLAATASTNIPVSASVSQNCSISTTSALAFVAYDPIGTNATAALNATGQISIACSKGATGLTIGMDNGAHVAGAQRQMLGGTAAGMLQYNIFQPPNNAPSTACTFPGTIAWTAVGAGMLTLTSAPTKVARVYSVCGTIPGGQDVAADTYTDTVSATINF
jgi:spore coat protein U-like protein